MTKKETFKWIVQIIASVATAILTALGATSCMVLNRKSVLEFDFQDALSVILCVVYLLLLAVISLKGKITKKCLEVWNYYRNFASYISKTTNL